MLHLLKNNLITLLQQHRTVVLLFTVSLFLSTITIFYSFGEIVSTVTELTSDTYRTFEIQTFEAEVTASSYAESIAALTQIPKIENVILILDDGVTRSYVNDFDYQIQYGTTFTNDTVPQIIVGTLVEPYVEVGEIVTIGTTEYTVVGKRMLADFNEVNYPALPDDTCISEIHVLSKKVLSRSAASCMQQTISNAFPDSNVISPPQWDFVSAYAQNNQLYIVLALILISIMIISFLYRYLLQHRKNTYAIYQICGCTKLRGSVLFLFELLVLSIPPFLLGLTVFKTAIEPLLINDWTYTSKLTASQAAGISLVFFVLLMIIFTPTIIMYAKQTPKELKYTHKD